MAAKKKQNDRKTGENKMMEEYREKRKRINMGAKIMAIILVAAMVVFYVISAGAFLWD